MNNKTATTPCELAANPSSAIQSAPTSRTHRGRSFPAWRTLRSLPLAIILLTVPAAFGQFGWVQQSPATSPAPKSNHYMAYDEARKQIVMFCAGQFPSGGTFIPSETWVWDGSTWIQKFPATSPPFRFNPVMEYDAAHSQVVMFSGVTFRDNNYLTDTWVWDGANWIQKAPTTVPLGRLSGSMAYDVRNHQLVMFGGFNLSASLLSDTWVWDGNNWIQQTPLLSPSARYAHAMVYDAARNQVMLYGGLSSSSLTDTWEWDGTNWMSISTANAPPKVADFKMASDTANRQVVLFGGNIGYNSWSAETWVFDGNNWTKQTPATVPVARSAHAMAFDSTKQQIVMFGGDGDDPYSEGGLTFGDTWVYQRLTPVRFTSNINSATFSVDGPYCQPGLGYTVPATLLWVPGAVCTVTFTNPISSAPGTQLVFDRWGDANGGASRSFTAPSTPASFDTRYKTQFYLTINTSPATAGTASGEGWYDAGSLASISAIPAPGYVFSGWTGPVASTTASSTTIGMGRAETVTANFDRQLVPVTITSATAQARFSVAGTGCAPGSYSVPQTLQWITGSSCAVSFVTPVSGAAGTQYVFTGWADGATGIARTVTAPAAATTYTGVYKTQYQLTLTANPSAGGTVSSGGFFDAGATPTVTATANAGYVFSGWSGPVASSTATSTTVSMTQPQTVTANFVQLVPVTITSATASATFSVTGVGCAPASYAVPQTLEWTPGSTCTVSFATPISGGTGTQYVFTGWADGATGNSRTIATPAAATTYTAVYKTQYQLTLAVSPAGTGTVAGAGFYDANTSAGLSATATAGYQFIGWTPALSPNTASASVVMTSPRSITATFALVSVLSVAPAAGQYSDAVALSVTIGPPGAAVSGSLQVQVDGATVGSPVSVTGSGVYTTSYVIGASAGSHAITAAFLPASPFVLGSTAGNSLTVTREDAILKPASSNLTTAQVSAPGGVANTITLTGQLQDAPDASLGDLSKAVVTVTLLPAVLGTPAISCTVTNAAGSLTATCPNVPVNAYAVQWSVSGGYYQAPQVNTVLAVYDPSLGFVTGGGSVVINGVPVDFSLSVKYQKNGSIGGGGVTLVLHQPGGDIRISSTVLNSMSIVGTTAVIDGQASVNGTGAVPIRVTVTDNGEPGINRDLLGVEASPAISFSPNAIAAGNIQMH